MKVIDTPTLEKMSAHSRRKNFNRTLHIAILKSIDPKGMHVLTSTSFIHGEVQCIRILTLLKMKNTLDPLEAVLDFDIDDYNRIPEYTPQTQGE